MMPLTVDIMSLDGDAYIKRFISIHGKMPTWMPSGDHYYSGGVMRRKWMSVNTPMRAKYSAEMKKFQKKQEDKAIEQISNVVKLADQVSENA